MSPPTETTVTVQPSRYVVIPLAASITGLSAKAIERKIEGGVWIEGREYRRGPDGRIYVDLKGYERWVEKAAA
jgi:hypothetical protein